MADVRAQLDGDERASAMMQAIRGTNLNDDDAALAAQEWELEYQQLQQSHGLRLAKVQARYR